MSLIISFVFSAETADNGTAVGNHAQKLNLRPTPDNAGPKDILGFRLSTAYSLPPGLVLTVVSKEDLPSFRRLFALCFSRYGSSLKSNTGTRSHLPVVAQMPSAVPQPSSHKAEVGQD